jgi:UDP-N-acetylglucosamine 1-carboxyvinyltransferase
VDIITIEGGHRLVGEVRASGSKNATLPLMAATLLADSPSRLNNAPKLRDVDTMGLMLEHLGVKFRHENGSIEMDPKGFSGTEAPYDLVRKMRASIYVLGPMLARLGRARVSMPGGCAIGTRPIDLHLRGFEALGAKIHVEHGYIDAEAPDGGLVGAECILDGPQGSSVGASCNVLLAAALAKGRSVLRGVACEPHVDDLVRFLRAMGANISGEGTGTLEVEGVGRLHGAVYDVIPDQIETATFLVAGIMTRGDITVRASRPDHLRTEIEKAREMGANVEIGEDWIRVRHEGPIKPVAIRTAPYPGFPTDAQAQFMAALAIASGESTIIDTIYPNRFLHAAEMNRMGAEIEIGMGSAKIRGVPSLTGAQVMASDLRASAALVLAGLVADGVTECLRVYHLDRGYDRLDVKLHGLGARIERISTSVSEQV